MPSASGKRCRAVPLRSYCTGLLLPGERKSIEPLAARLAPHDVRRVHQSLHHFVANAPWSDEALLERVRHSVLPRMKRNGPIMAWIVDDTGFPKKGTHSVGVVRQYCGQVGKQENCRIAVSLSLATEPGQSSDRVAPVPARDLGPGSEAPQGDGHSARGHLCHQDGDRASADSEGGRGRSHTGSRFGRCRLWQR
jgi:hypothetical protein